MSPRKPYRKHRGLLSDLYLEAKPKQCALCDGPIPPPLRKDSKRRKLCKLEECAKAYQRLYGALLRDRERARP